MVQLITKNIKDVGAEQEKDIVRLCEEKLDFYNQLFKNYGKDLKLELIFNKSASMYKISASLNLKSKKILLAKEGKDPLKVTTGLLNDFKKKVKRQYELERKDYEYKRKR